MPTCKLIRPALFSMVMAVSVACAGDVLGVEITAGGKVFGAEVKAGEKTFTVTYTGTTDSTPELQTREKRKVAAAELPRELSMRPLPIYRIEPPDILQIEIANLKAAGKPGCQSSDHVEQGTLLGSTGTDSQSGSLARTGAGTLTIGSPAYVVTSTFDNAAPTNTGTVTVRGTVASNLVGAAKSSDTTTMTWRMLTTNGDTSTAVAKVPVTTLSANIVKMDAKVARVPPASGQYMVSPDGTVNLRQCGSVQVMGLTIAEAKAALEKQLSKYFDSPEVSVDVIAYNSKVYYVITEGAGLGDNVRRIPITGKETVLDAMAAINGLSQVSSKRIWLARPSPSNSEKGTTLPIDYAAITQRGATATNYQIMPGDRIFIAEDRVTALNNWLTKMTMPIERVMGVISLGAATIRNIQELLPQEAHP